MSLCIICISYVFMYSTKPTDLATALPGFSTLMYSCTQQSRQILLLLSRGSQLLCIHVLNKADRSCYCSPGVLNSNKNASSSLQTERRVNFNLLPVLDAEKLWPHETKFFPDLYYIAVKTMKRHFAE